MCPQTIPGTAPSGTSTEQISDATASAEKWSISGCRAVAADGNADPGRDGAGGIGPREGGVPPAATFAVTAGGALETAAGMVIVFWQVGQAI